MIVTIIILSITTIVFLYTTINLLRKNEAHEDVVVEQEELIAEIAKKVDESMARMKDIDKLGSFEADDETGYIFKNLYEVIEDLEKYYGTQEEE
ncbi:hypothetical protein N9W01_00035 [bacterium]|jgi:hypothetical protein|nr:hypothetical protein [bacterium]